MALTVADVIDNVRDWTEKNVCKKIKLKCEPASEDEPNDGDYNYRMVHPACFALFVPTNDKLPPEILSSVPSVCVRVMKGENNMTNHMGVVNLELSIATWSTGTHRRDILVPDKTNGTIKEWDGDGNLNYFDANGDGWRDAWNVVDLILRELQSTSSINGIAIDRSTPIEFGAYSDQKIIPDMYPNWYTWVSLTCNYPIAHTPKEYEQFL